LRKVYHVLKKSKALFSRKSRGLNTNKLEMARRPEMTPIEVVIKLYVAVSQSIRYF
jgi:hypothetical protein